MSCRYDGVIVGHISSREIKRREGREVKNVIEVGYAAVTMVQMIWR